MGSFFDSFHCVDGLWLPQHITEDNVRTVRTFPVHDKDIMVCGYPKSGNVWMMKTIHTICKLADEAYSDELVCFPIEHRQKFAKYETVPKPTVLMSHLRYNMLPCDLERKNMKIVHITRNPKDAAISHVYFWKVVKLVPQKPSLDEYIANYVRGKVLYGTWFDYMKDWLTQLDNPNVHFVKYEDYIRNPRQTILEVSNFLGKPLPTGAVDEVLAETCFETMKARDSKTADPQFYDTRLGGHVRKGKIGDWKDHFTEEHNKVFDNLYHEFVHETGYTVTFE